jgi:hypothetical protein
LREGKKLKGHLLGFVLETIGRSVLEKEFVNSIKAARWLVKVTPHSWLMQTAIL